MEGKRTKAKKSFSIDAIISAYESDGDGSTTSHGSGDYDHSRERRPSPANKSPMETKSQQSSELRRGDEHSPSSRASCTPPTTPPQRPAPILAGNLSPATSLQMQMMGNVQAAAAAQAALFGAGAGGHLFPTAPGLPAHQQGQPGAGSSNASAAAANIQAALASYTLFQHQQQQMANSHLQQHHHHHHQMAQAQAQAQANQRAMAMDGFFNPWLSSLSARHGHHRLLPGLGGSHGLSDSPVATLAAHAHAHAHSMHGFLFHPYRKPKRIRTAFSPSQLLRLEHAFEKNHYVVGTERKQLAQTLGLSETQVKIWFQNRRTKHKRLKSDGDAEADNGMESYDEEDAPDPEQEPQPESSSPRPASRTHQQHCDISPLHAAPGEGDVRKSPPNGTGNFSHHPSSSPHTPVSTGASFRHRPHSFSL